jgi:hypothetical protein
MGQFDQTARYAVKLDPPGFFRWLFGYPEPPLAFREWLDTRRLPFPGDPERTGDVVADFDNREAPGGRYALILEFQTDPDPNITERLTIYAMLLRQELPRPAGGDKYPVGAAVVNLRGSPASADLILPLPGCAGRGMFIRPLPRNLADEDAAATLAGVAAGGVAPCLLPWIPLMRGGDVPAIITEWKRLAGQEADGARRSAYGGLALVFAELAKTLVEWQKGLEGWNVLESQVILGWKREGKQEGFLEATRAHLLMVLEIRFQAQVPAEMKAAIEGTNDLDTLSHWLRTALKISSLDDFRAAMAS